MHPRHEGEQRIFLICIRSGSHEVRRLSLANNIAICQCDNITENHDNILNLVKRVAYHLTLKYSFGTNTVNQLYGQGGSPFIGFIGEEFEIII